MDARRGGLLALVRTLGIPTVVVLHDLDLAARYCNHVVLLDRGSIVRAGAPAKALVPEVLEPVHRVRVLDDGDCVQLVFRPDLRPTASTSASSVTPANLAHAHLLMFLWVMTVGSEHDPAVEALRAVASPLRLAILAHLARTPMAVQDLADRLAVSQPLVLHHLSVLRRAGLVTVRRSGRRAIHAPTEHPVVGLALAALEEMRRTRMTTTEHARHTDHAHAHGEGCGHVAVPHVDHVDYAHDGHLHRVHDGHWDECETAEHVAHDGHDHAHGEGCGHVAVPHGDHVDYLHDGHRHAAHDGHYDDH